MSDRDPYMVLGVPPVARIEEIKVAYRKLSREFHPDVNADISSAAQDKMKQFTAAYEIISGKQKREDYDHQPLFKPRVPRGFSGNVSIGALTRKQPEKKPGALEKLMGYFVKVEKKPQRDPAAAQTHFTMGMSLVEQVSFYNDAREEFEAAMKADPTLLEAAYNYGLMSYKLGDWEQARVGFQKATRVKASDSFSRQMLDLLRPETM